MAQLVKMLDYISRYENDLTRYPTQYIRLKRSQWERMKAQWESGSTYSMWEQKEEDTELEERKRFSSLFRLFRSRGKDTAQVQIDHKEIEEEEDDFNFEPNINYRPANIEQLQKLYLDQLFHFQLKWASSTLTDKSPLDARYMRDSLLRSFTQQLPDSYLLFYYPVIVLQKAPVELDIIMMTPVECMCITVLEEGNMAAYVGSGDRFWLKRHGENESKLLNPLIGLDRMENIVSRIFKKKAIDFPIRKYLISRNGYIDVPNIAFDIEIVDRRTYESWFLSLGKSSTPMKFTQFKAAQAILDVGLTTAASRLFEYEKEE